MFLTFCSAIAFREWLGGEKVIYDYCHQLAVDGAKRLAEILGTRVLDEHGELTTTMVSEAMLLLRFGQPTQCC